MNRIDNTFDKLKKANRKALITFITAGDPNLDITEKILLTMDKAGADIIEIGVPFSDPIAEDLVIQKSNRRSLDNGTKLVNIFDLLKQLRTRIEKPFILKLYLNSIFGFGTERFFTLCRECGVDGVIIPDMPYEERDEIQGYADKFGVYSISLVAAITGDRISKIAIDSKGFLYCIPYNMSSFRLDNEEFFDEVKSYSTIPCAVSFGLYSSKQVKDMNIHCDGVIIDSEIVKLIEEYKEDSERPVYNFIKSLRGVLSNNNIV